LLKSIPLASGRLQVPLYERQEVHRKWSERRHPSEMIRRSW
jgi:hypothetical protein